MVLYHAIACSYATTACSVRHVRQNECFCVVTEFTEGFPKYKFLIEQGYASSSVTRPPSGTESKLS